MKAPLYVSFTQNYLIMCIIHNRTQFVLIFDKNSSTKYIKPIPESERGDFVQAYYKRLTGNDEVVKVECAKSWSVWECATSRLYQDQEYIDILFKNTKIT